LCAEIEIIGAGFVTSVLSFVGCWDSEIVEAIVIVKFLATGGKSSFSHNTVI
jgi:hypothetical protein